jgi:hypothetical protein
MASTVRWLDPPPLADHRGQPRHARCGKGRADQAWVPPGNGCPRAGPHLPASRAPTLPRRHREAVNGPSAGSQRPGAALPDPARTCHPARSMSWTRLPSSTTRPSLPRTTVPSARWRNSWRSGHGRPKTAWAYSTSYWPCSPTLRAVEVLEDLNASSRQLSYECGNAQAHRTTRSRGADLCGAACRKSRY